MTALSVAVQLAGPLVAVGALPAELAPAATVGDVAGRPVDARAVADAVDAPRAQRTLVLTLRGKGVA